MIINNNNNNTNNLRELLATSVILGMRPGMGVFSGSEKVAPPGITTESPREEFPL